MVHLGIDTATSRGSIALAGAGTVLAASELRERGAHARDLLREIAGLLEGCGLPTGSLSDIAVTAGPGSFTGLRVGMATAKGLAYALNIALGGLSTLEATALAATASMPPGATHLCAAIEAGRGEVYAALFLIEAAGPARSTSDRSWRPGDLAAGLPSGCLLAGDGTPRVLDAGRSAGRLLRSTPCPSLAPAIALWAARTIRPGEGYRAGALVPNYIRPSDAEAARRRP